MVLDQGGGALRVLTAQRSVQAAAFGAEKLEDLGHLAGWSTGEIFVADLQYRMG